MEFDKTLTDSSVLSLLGERIAKHRLNKNLTQAQLAHNAGVSLSTLNRMESGSSSQINNLVRVLQALDLLENISLLVPEPPASPIQQAKLAGKTRQRARPGKPDTVKENQTWTWAAPISDEPASSDPDNTGNQGS